MYVNAPVLGMASELGFPRGEDLVPILGSPLLSRFIPECTTRKTG